MSIWNYFKQKFIANQESVQVKSGNQNKVVIVNEEIISLLNRIIKEQKITNQHLYSLTDEYIEE